MKVSVITPSFNQGDYIEETILSVLNQKYSDVEYIIIDGGSTDQTVNIIKKYASRVDYWISEPDSGQAAAINKGMKMATGDLICWINSDDLLYTHFVAEMVQLFEKYPFVDFIYRDVEQGVNLSNRRLRKGKTTDFNNILKTFDLPVPQQGTMWKKEVLDKAGYLQEKWHVILDREFFTRIFYYCNTLYIPGAVAFFRNHINTKSVAQSYKWIEELNLFLDDIYIENIYELSHKFLSLKKHSVVNVSLMNSKISQKNGNKNEYNRFLNKAKKTHIRLYLYYKYWVKLSVSIRKVILKHIVTLNKH